jgi:phosphatidylserine decarboxylase
MDYVLITLAALLISSAIFIFWVAKGGFNKRYLYTDNITMGLTGAIIALLIYRYCGRCDLIHIAFLLPVIEGLLFLCLFFYRFFRNPRRNISSAPDEFLSPADGRVIYIKELESGQLPVSVKKKRVSSIEEITKTKILEQPCYLIGIAMTLFDVHVNRAPISGKVILVKHTDGDALGLNKPESTIVNERNTIVIERNDGVKVGVIQIAARFVRRCIVSVKEGSSVSKGDEIGKIRWGSQADLVIPRNCEICVREGEQVYAGLTVIAKLIDAK